MLIVAGCGHPEEGTVTVSPEARARLRGGPTPEPAKAKAGVRKGVEVRARPQAKPAD